MSIDFVLDAEKREDQGKGASRRLRHAGKIPAIIYGAGREPMPISLDHNQVQNSLNHEAFYSHILTVKLDGAEEKAVLRDLQRHPSRPTILHMDLQRVSADEKIRVHAPLHFINEDICVGVKQGGGTVSHQLVEIEVQCLPANLPEFIEVDIAALNVGESLHLSDLKLPAGVEIVELLHGAEHDNAVVTIHKPRGAGTEEAAEESSGETEGGE